MSHSTHHIIPENERFCVWMDAGVVDYKLCNLQFKCDECAFDAQVRTEQGAAKTASSAPGSSASADDICTLTLQQVLRSIDRTPLPADRLYAANHTWAKVSEAEDGACTLGVDHFMGAMLASAHSVACSMPGTHVKASEPYAWIVANGETLAVRSPVSGTIIGNNPALADRQAVLHADPYEKGWIARIRPDKDQRRNSLQPAERFAAALKHDADRFEKAIRSKFREMRPASGATMFDGGTVLAGFEDMLGTKTYYGILEHFLRS